MRHAAPPPGEWINDPNGLIFRDGQWRLFVQHSAAAPDFKVVGWARLSSPDLLHWTWDGPVIPPNPLGQAYSGSIVAEGEELAAYLTRHDGTLQRQVRLASGDHGLTWREGPPLGPEGRNVRDPFVFHCRATGNWRMLVAEPCDWTDWPSDPPSRLAVWRKDGEAWQFVAHVGPWMPSGVMWEVPVLVDFGATQALILSIVDRRSGSSECAVRYWLGRFDGEAFATTSPSEGLLLDHGPDFYAAIVAADEPPERTLVAWASSWATARAMPWPGAIMGGPISLPRRLILDAQAGRLVQSPAPDLAPVKSWCWDAAEPLAVTINGIDCSLTISLDASGLDVTRSGSQLLDWHRREALDIAAPQTIDLYEDAGLVEPFIRPAGLTVTAFLPGARL